MEQITRRKYAVIDKAPEGSKPTILNSGDQAGAKDGRPLVAGSVVQTTSAEGVVPENFANEMGQTATHILTGQGQLAAGTRRYTTQYAHRKAVYKAGMHLQTTRRAPSTSGRDGHRELAMQRERAQRARQAEAMTADATSEPQRAETPSETRAWVQTQVYKGSGDTH